MLASDAVGSKESRAALPPRPARGERHLWVPRGLGNAALLLGLVVDRERGHPNNIKATARQFGVDPKTCRAWRRQLLEAGWIVERDGHLVATPGLDLRRQWDPLPRALLRGPGPRPSPKVLLAAAVVYSDAVGWRSERHGCRSDAERASLAGVHRGTIIAARQMLDKRMLVTIEALTRGRADLRRVRLTTDRRATHGSPMGDQAAHRLAELAARGRVAPRRGRELSNSAGRELSDTPMQSLRETLPLQGPSAPPRAGSQVELFRHGYRSSESVGSRGAESAGQVLAVLLPDLPAFRAVHEGQAKTSREAAAGELRRIAAGPQVMQNLLAQAPEKAIGGLLAAAGVFDMVPKRRAGLAMQVSQVLSVTQVLMIALDVLLGGPSNIGAVLRVRLNRALAGRRDLLTRCRASWSIDHFLKRSGACEVSARAEATILSHETAAIEAARAGNWRMVHFALGRPTARERGWSVAWLSNRSGLPESSIEAGISELARRRATG